MQIATLMSGTILSQALMFLFMPILTRLYTPAEFGVYSLFFAVTAILGLTSSWKYDQAIMLPRSDKDAQALVFLSLVITFIMVILISIGLFLFYDRIVIYFENASYVIWLIPIGVLLIGLIQIFSSYTSRHQYYKGLATARVANTVTAVGIQSVSKYSMNMDGLIVGKLVADLVTLVLLVREHVKRQHLQLLSLSRRRLRVNAKKYENFPKYTSFGGFINEFSQNLPILLLTSLFSVEIAGFYALTVRILQVPTSLIGKSTREVFYQRASKMHAAGEDIYELYKKTTLALLKIFIVPFFLFLLSGEYLFGFIFGDEWSTSGVFSQLLIFWFLFLFINSPSMISFDILGLQRLSLIIQIVSVIFKIGAFYIGYWYDSFYMSIALFSLVSAISNIVIIVMIAKLLRREKKAV